MRLGTAGSDGRGVAVDFADGHRSVNMHKLDGVIDIDIEIERLGRLASPIRHEWKD